MAQRTMKLKTADEQIIDVDVEIVNMFNVLKTMLLDLGGDVDETPIPVQVDLKILQQVIAWCVHHKNDPIDKQSSSGSSSDEEDDDDDEEMDHNRQEYKRDKKYDIDLDPWDDTFLKELDPENEDAVFPLILAANYLDVSKLLDTCCSYVAGILRGRTPQWIRKRFKLKCDFTEEQKAKIREELSWYDDNIKISDDEEPQSQPAAQ